jgi:hypothetical protein
LELLACGVVSVNALLRKPAIMGNAFSGHIASGIHHTPILSRIVDEALWVRVTVIEALQKLLLPLLHYRIGIIPETGIVYALVVNTAGSISSASLLELLLEHEGLTKNVIHPPHAIGILGKGIRE